MVHPIRAIGDSDKCRPSCVYKAVRLVISAFLALALGLLPAGTARAQTAAAAPPSTMSCHDMGAMDHDTGSVPEAPSHDMQGCADHCMSQVNAQVNVSRLSGPSLQNAITAPLADAESAFKHRLREAPDPPPPRL
jgi:hypothetical protein